MSAESIGWHDEQDQDDRRRVRNAVYVSIGVHVALFAALVISPPISIDPMPQSIAVELVAGPPIAAPAAPRPAARRRPAPPPPEPAVEEAAPEPPPEPAPPIAKAPVQVLPENEPAPQKKVQQAPEKKPKAAKEPAKQPDKSLSYDDAMKSLDEELGEDETEDLLAPPPSRPAERVVATSGGAPESRAGASVNAEDAAWGLAMRRRVQSQWVMLSQYQGRGLATVLELEISAAGELIGEPEVIRTSGDPYFDDHAVQGVLKSTPLPVPPRPGRRILIFKSEEY